MHEKRQRLYISSWPDICICYRWLITQTFKLPLRYLTAHQESLWHEKDVTIQFQRVNLEQS